MRIETFRTFKLATFAFGVALIVADSASASHKWSTYHWARTTKAFNLTIINNLGPNWSKYLVNGDTVTGTIAQWNNPSDPRVLNAGQSPRSRNQFITLIQGTSGTQGDCSAVVGKTVVCNTTAVGSGWLGIAQIWLSGSHITQGTATMNDYYFNLSTYNNDNEKLHVVCQETAHTFGLGHQSTSGVSVDTCMDYFSNTSANATSTKSTWPNTHDFGMLEKIYGGHADSISTLSMAAAQMAAVPADLRNPKEWGRLVEQANGGRHSNYERVFPNGVRVLTDVLWAPDIAAACPSCDHRNQRAP